MIGLGLAGVKFSSQESVWHCVSEQPVLTEVKPPQLPMLKSASLVPPELLFLKAGSWAVRMLN